MTKEIELSQALSAKICHDLSGAIGTIDNCLSLLENDDPSIKDQARELVNIESANLISRIRFFKIAYGIEDDEGQTSAVKISKLLKDFIKGLGMEIDLKIDDGILLIDTKLAKCIIVIASIAADNICNRGNLTVELKGGNDTLEVGMAAFGGNLTIKEESLKMLSNSNKSKVNVKNCRELYAKTLLSDINYKISVNMDSDSIQYKITRS